MRTRLAIAIAGLLAATPALAGSLSVYVGYADGLRAGADFPNPFAAGTTFGGAQIVDFVGNLSGTPDTGAVMVINTGTTNALITNLDVNDRATGNDYQIWTGNGAGQLGAGITLAPGQGAIFAENNGNNFDASDYGQISGYAGFDPNTNNCSTGALASTAYCMNEFPILTFTANGSDAVFNDTAHVLDTGGYDSAGYVHHHSNGTDSTNESLQWRPIGTTGINNPGGGGQVPEPASLAILGIGLAGMVVSRRR